MIQEEILKTFEEEISKYDLILAADAIPIIKSLDKEKINNLIFYIRDKINEIKDKNSGVIDKSFLLNYLSKNTEKNIPKIENTKSKENNKKTILSFLNKQESKQNAEVKVEVIIRDNVKKFESYELETSVNVVENLTKKINILKKYDIRKSKVDILTWVSYYKNRLNKIKKMLEEHRELKHIYPLDKIPENEEVGIAGIVYDKRFTDKGVMYIIEDGNKKVKVFVGKDDNIDSNYKEYYKHVPLDAVIGFVGRYNKEKNLFIAEKVIFPDIPRRNIKLGRDDIYILFTGDWQIGSKYTIQPIIDKFIRFVNAKTSNETLNNISRKIAYISIVGDVVDGVGIYPEQEKELILNTYEKQYDFFQKILLNIPEYIDVLVIPGNHDIPRLAEPQPELDYKVLPDLKGLNNIFLLSNPSVVEVHESIKILMYHGYSLDWFVSEIPILREKGGYENPGELMKFLLMLRHLAPTHGSTPYLPYINEDPLLISEIPDIFHTGHIHRAFYGEYRGTELINSSTFQDITPYQIELGHKPQPGVVFLRNIKSGEVLRVDLINEEVRIVRDKVL